MPNFNLLRHDDTVLALYSTADKVVFSWGTVGSVQDPVQELDGRRVKLDLSSGPNKSWKDVTGEV